MGPLRSESSASPVFVSGWRGTCASCRSPGSSATPMSPARSGSSCFPSPPACAAGRPSWHSTSVSAPTTFGAHPHVGGSRGRRFDRQRPSSVSRRPSSTWCTASTDSRPNESTRCSLASTSGSIAPRSPPRTATCSPSGATWPATTRPSRRRSRSSTPERSSSPVSATWPE
jgi:hypothetical protein